MIRAAHRFVLLAAFVITAAMLCACSPGIVSSVSSAYDVAGMLECDPKDLPDTLEEMGFKYSEGAPYGPWEASGPVEGQPECRSCCLMFYGSTPDLLREGNAPSQASFSFQYAPIVTEDEASSLGDDMLTRAGFSEPFYTDRVENTRFGRVDLYRVGRVDGEGPAAYWTLWIDIDEEFGYTTYMISAYTENAARNDTSSPIAEALAAENA